MGLIHVVEQVTLVVLAAAFPVILGAVSQVAGAANVLLDGLGDLHAVFIGGVGVVHAAQAGGTQCCHAGVEQGLGLAVGLVLHDGLHAAGEVGAVQITVEHIAVTGVHVAHGHLGHHLVGGAGAHAGLIIVDGGSQGGSYALAGIVVGVQTDVEGVLALLQHIAAVAIAVEGSQIVSLEVDGHGLGLARFDEIGLLVADEDLCGLLQAGALDAAGLVGVVGGGHVQLHHLLAGLIAGVGDGDADGVGAVGLQVYLGGLHLLGESGVAQAVAEGVLDHLVIALCLAVLPLMVGEEVAVEEALCVGGLIEPVAHIDAFLVLIVAHVGGVAGGVLDGAHVGVLVVVVVVEGGHGGHIVSVGIHQTAGGVHVAGQDLGNAHKTGFAGMADPQAGVHAVRFLLDLAQLDHGGGVHQHDGLAKVLLAELQQVLLILAQLQVSGAGGGGAVAVIVHDGGSAFCAGPAEGDDGHTVVAVSHEFVLVPLVDFLGKFADLGVSAPVALAVVVLVLLVLGALEGDDLALAVVAVEIGSGVHVPVAAHGLFQPGPGLLVHIEILLGAQGRTLGLGAVEGFLHGVGVLVVLTAGGTGAAVDVVVGHGAQNGHLGALCQGQGVVLIPQQDRALCQHIGNEFPSLGQEGHFVQVQVSVGADRSGVAHITGQGGAEVVQQDVHQHSCHQQHGDDNDTRNQALVLFHVFRSFSDK